MDKIKNLSKAKKIAILAMVLTALLVVYEFSPFGGNARFYAKWAECGQKPVAENVSITFGAKPKSYVYPDTFEPFRFGQPRYFCTPLEAEQAGYSANPDRYEFPHLKAEKQ